MDDFHISLATMEAAFREHYEGLHRYAYTLLKENETAKDAVQQVFLNIWEKRNHLNISISLKSYLYRAVHNYCINHNTRERRYLPIEPQTGGPVQNSFSAEIKELEKQVTDALNQLSPQCKTVFLKNREQGMTYSHISQEMNISVKTVEAHMTKALRILRELLLSDMDSRVALIFILIYL
jgi:RNA polymerase sigma-70 factor, ECF subfamily